MLGTLAKELIRVAEEIEDAERRLRELRDKREAIEGSIMEGWALHGIQKMTVGGRTLYKTTKKYTSILPGRRREAVEAARKLGLDDMICLQPTTFAAWCRQMLEDPGSELPEELRELVNTYETPRVLVRRS